MIWLLHLDDFVAVVLAAVWIMVILALVVSAVVDFFRAVFFRRPGPGKPGWLERLLTLNGRIQ